MELGKEGLSDLKAVARTVAERQPEKQRLHWCGLGRRRQSWRGGVGEEGKELPFQKKVALALHQLLRSLEVGWEVVSTLSLRLCKQRLGK